MHFRKDYKFITNDYLDTLHHIDSHFLCHLVPNATCNTQLHTNTHSYTLTYTHAAVNLIMLVKLIRCKNNGPVSYQHHIGVFCRQVADLHIMIRAVVHESILEHQ